MENQYEEITLNEILLMLAKRWWLILIFTFICVVFTSIYSIYYLKPIYQADTSLYVGKDLETRSIVYNDLIMAERLANDYREIVKSRFITGLVIEEMGLSMTANDLAKKINVQSKKDTRLIEITVEDTDPVLAKEIADTVALTFKENIVEIIDVENVQIIDTAVVPQRPIRPNIKLNIAIAFVLGAMMGLFITFILEYFDKTVKTPEDVKRCTGLPVIGVIPTFKE